jgi:hypothetical protein
MVRHAVGDGEASGGDSDVGAGTWRRRGDSLSLDRAASIVSVVAKAVRYLEQQGGQTKNRLPISVARWRTILSVCLVVENRYAAYWSSIGVSLKRALVLNKTYYFIYRQR